MEIRRIQETLLLICSSDKIFDSSRNKLSLACRRQELQTCNLAYSK